MKTLLEKAESTIEIIQGQVKILRRESKKLEKKYSVSVPITKGPDRGYSYLKWESPTRKAEHRSLESALYKRVRLRDSLKREVKHIKKSVEKLEGLLK
jgi:uncharacterized protein YoxC